MQVVLLLGAIRLLLALAGVGAATLRGVDVAVAFATFAVGLVVLAFTVITTRQGRWSGRDVQSATPFHDAVAAQIAWSRGYPGETR